MTTKPLGLIRRNYDERTGAQRERSKQRKNSTKQALTTEQSTHCLDYWRQKLNALRAKTTWTTKITKMGATRQKNLTAKGRLNGRT